MASHAVVLEEEEPLRSKTGISTTTQSKFTTAKISLVKKLHGEACRVQ